MATISEFDFKIRYIKCKENRLADDLSRPVQVNLLATMGSYGTDLQDRILQAIQQDVRYMEIVYKLQQGVGTCRVDITSTGIGVGIGTCSGIGTSGSKGTGTSAGAQGMDYCLTVDGLVRFRDRIYVSDRSELKKVIFREFHVKPYSHHRG